MNWRCPKKFPRPAAWLGVVIYLLLGSPLRAEVEDRWLLIFNTSAEMKKRLPGTEATLKILLETSAAGQLKAGDSVGVWRFCQQLHADEYVPTDWNPLTASVTASNLVKFVHRQWYAGETRMAVLQPALNQIIAASDRLTVLIFCDGTSEINWSPYDTALNQTFRQNFAERKKSQQPFVVLLRAQQGKLIGCTVSFPPGGITFPPFQPKPEPPKPVVVPPVTPPPKPMPVVAPPVNPATSAPSLIVVGKQVFTNLNDAKKSIAPVVPAPATNPPTVTNPVPLPVPPVVSNPPVVAPPPVIAPPVVTNVPPAVQLVVSSPPPAKVSVAPTNPVLAPSNHTAVKPVIPATNVAKAIVSGTNTVKTVAPQKTAKAGKPVWLLAAGGILLLAGLILVVGLVVRSRRPINSLITDSLNVSKEPPPKK